MSSVDGVGRHLVVKTVLMVRLAVGEENDDLLRIFASTLQDILRMLHTVIGSGGAVGFQSIDGIFEFFDMLVVDRRKFGTRVGATCERHDRDGMFIGRISDGLVGLRRLVNEVVDRFLQCIESRRLNILVELHTVGILVGFWFNRLTVHLPTDMLPPPETVDGAFLGNLNVAIALLDIVVRGK